MASKLFNIRDVLTYFVIAATGALLQLLVCSLMQEWFFVSYKQALSIGYWVAFVVGFVLTKLFAFNARNAAQNNRETIKFCLVSILSWLITVYGSALFYSFSQTQFGIQTIVIPFSVKEVNLNKLFSQVTAMGASFLSNYILHKRFTFRNTGFYERLKVLLGI